MTAWSEPEKTVLVPYLGRRARVVLHDLLADGVFDGRVASDRVVQVLVTQRLGELALVTVSRLLEQFPARAERWRESEIRFQSSTFSRAGILVLRTLKQARNNNDDDEQQKGQERMTLRRNGAHLLPRQARYNINNRSFRHRTCS